ncbi:DUF2189 domain-containing protein [Cereibacter changlensis]|uniref:DUF2189 domain-containing protein n=2 Tax=Cereibacter changlensis TaxID=402884 RepID=A0A4U0YVH8_9RHOB|nr:DUF2189 domain-containing protein [Cereibacter changlensis]
MLNESNGPAQPDPLDPVLPEGLPEVVPPLPVPNLRARNLPWSTAIGWLVAGWSDFCTNPLPSVIYGTLVFAVSIAFITSLFSVGMDYYLFPAMAGFLVLGPLVAGGLYEKSRRISEGATTGLSSMLLVRPLSGHQAIFMGTLLLLLFLLWMRAAVIIYAIFFGIRPFLGADQFLPTLFLTPTGWSMLMVGSAVGALFAAFAFAASVFSIPMLIQEDTDALTAMGVSIALAWNNLKVMLCWGAIVVGFFLISAFTGFVSLIVIFPVLGHGTWHSYRTIRVKPDIKERVFYSPA